MRRLSTLILSSAMLGLVMTAAPSPAAATAVEFSVAHEQWKAADKRLNDVYKQLMSRLDATGRSRLVKAELAWIAFRDAEVRFHEDRMRGGTGAGTLGEQMKTSLTVSRADTLSDLMVDMGVEDGATKHPSKQDLQGALATQKEAAVHADRQLNKYYRLVMGAIDPQARRLLTQSELKWITLRDLDAALWAGAMPGSPFVDANYQSGLAYVTDQRAKDLKDLWDLWNSR